MNASEILKETVARLRTDASNLFYWKSEDNKRDAMTIAAAVLPLFDETPIDEPWLRSMGFKPKTYQGNTVLALRIASGPIGDDQWIELHDQTNGAFVLCRWSPVYDDPEDDSDMPPDRVEAVAATRGDVRRLCAALGIEIKEKV